MFTIPSMARTVTLAHNAVFAAAVAPVEADEPEPPQPARPKVRLIVASKNNNFNIELFIEKFSFCFSERGWLLVRRQQ
jgi:hypothetical protein